MINIKPEIKVLNLKDIKPCLDNPRDITDPALEGLHNSLDEFGYIDLLVINKRNMEIVSGHQRYKIFQKENIERVHCILVDVDTMHQQAMAISLNNQQIMGYWTAALIPILEKIRLNLPEEYLNLRLSELREEVNQFESELIGNTLPDDIPEPPKKAITKPGYLWILGQHRLLCGDSTNEKDIKKLFNGKKANLFATDPPYCVDYTGKDRPEGGGKDWSNVYKETEIKNAELFWHNFLKEGLKFVNSNTAIYIWHATKMFSVLEKVLNDLNILLHQVLIWKKPAAVLSFSIYPWLHEPCIFGWKKKEKPFFRPHHKKIGTVWTIGLMRSGDPESPEYYCDLWNCDWENKQRAPGGMHPTVKPVELFAIPMRVHTKPGDICYEPFSGSGSQIIAAEKLNRKCYAIEKEPVFVDVAVKRWEDFTGKKAKLLKK